MPAKIASREMLEQKEIQASMNVEYSLIGPADQGDSEIQWVKLHQMFDR